MVSCRDFWHQHSPKSSKAVQPSSTVSTCTSSWLGTAQVLAPQRSPDAWDSLEKSMAPRHHLGLCAFFFLSALQAFSLGRMSRKCCVFCWLSMYHFLIFREKASPQRCGCFHALMFLQSLHCFFLLLLSVKVLMSDVSLISFFNHTFHNHLGSFVAQFKFIVTTTVI